MSISKESLLTKRNQVQQKVVNRKYINFHDAEIREVYFQTGWDACTEVLWPEIERFRNEPRISVSVGNLEDLAAQVANLERQLEIAVEALDKIAANKLIKENLVVYFEELDHGDLVEAAMFDTLTARQALKEIKE